MPPAAGPSPVVANAARPRLDRRRGLPAAPIPSPGLPRHLGPSPAMRPAARAWAGQEGRVQPGASRRVSPAGLCRVRAGYSPTARPRRAGRRHGQPGPAGPPLPARGPLPCRRTKAHSVGRRRQRRQAGPVPARSPCQRSACRAARRVEGPAPMARAPVARSDRGQREARRRLPATARRCRQGRPSSSAPATTPPAHRRRHRSRRRRRARRAPGLNGASRRAGPCQSSPAADTPRAPRGRREWSTYRRSRRRHRPAMRPRRRRRRRGRRSPAPAPRPRQRDGSGRMAGPTTRGTSPGRGLNGRAFAPSRVRPDVAPSCSSPRPPAA